MKAAAFAVAILLIPAVLAAVAPPEPPTPASSPSWKVVRDQREAMEKLPERYRQWVLEVDPILTQDERAAFLALTKDYQRDAFIQRFWEVRDPNPRTGRNEFRERWEAKVQAARLRFADLSDVRARIFLLNGPPETIIESKCPLVLWPLEVWYYRQAERVGEELFAVFYRKWGEPRFRLWHPSEGVAALVAEGVAQTAPANLSDAIERITDPINGCGDADKSIKIAAALRWAAQRGLSYELVRARFESAPEGSGKEWISTFHSYSTDLPEGASPLPANLEVDFPGRHLSQTVLQGMVTVAGEASGAADFAGYRSWSFLLTGEILRDGQLFESFRYKFAFSAAEASFPLVFQRYVRPGEYTLVIKVEDVDSGKLYREERRLTVPVREQQGAAETVAALEPESARLLAEANAAIGTGEPTIKIVQPHGELQTGMLRFDTLVTGSRVAGVTFLLDGKPVLTKKRPPFSVELDLGPLPRTLTLTVSAFDAAGAELASDELLVNAAAHRFRVELVEPRKGRRYEGSLLVRAEAEPPEGGSVERVELFLNETPVATLFQPPWEQPILLPAGESLAYVRAVAYLTDGNSTEDLVFVNAPENLEELDIDLVELYTTVLDRRGRPVQTLAAGDFTIFEDGGRQEVVRFERLIDQPVHAAVAIDVSASMTDSLDQARQAALEFLQSTIRPKDRAAVITFNDHPNLAAKFTSDLGILAGGLAGLKAERGTALYDTLIFSLFYFNGIKGQRALLLLSDGKDEGSRFGYEEALEYARRAGVIIYTIGLGKEVDKKKLERIAEETGGRSFLPRDAAELAGIYATIEQELRSQYLIAYQSTNTGGSSNFRTVELKVGKAGLEANTLRGYYP